MDHIAEHDVPDLGAIDIGARQRLPGDPGAEFGGRDVFRAAAEIADGGADTGDDVDLALHVGGTSSGWLNGGIAYAHADATEGKY